MKIKTLYTRLIFVVALLLSLGIVSHAQSLALSSAVIPAGGTTNISLSLSSAPANPLAAIQWTIGFPAANVASLSLTGGPALASAGKTLSCANSVNTYTCVAWGMNSAAISDGVVATVSVSVSGASDVPLTINNILGASPTGGSVAVGGTGGTISVA